MNTLNETKIIVPAEHTESVARAIFALEEGTFTKIICGAANTNEKHVEKLAMVYALSGVNVIDVAPSQTIIQSAKAGIKKASDLYNKNPEAFAHYKEPVLMVSLDAGDDLHFRKAEINYSKCSSCFECINSCPARALSTVYSSKGDSRKNLHTADEIIQSAVQEDKKIQLNKNNCFGCGRCSESCLQNAISFTKLSNSSDFDFKEIKAIEIHTGSSSIEEVKNFLELNAQLLTNIELLSFCVESKRFNTTELLDYTSSLTELVPQKVILQVDGVPMGATDKPSSSLQAVSAAAILLENKTNAYIQISGGTNYFTKKLVNQLDLKISGIGYGTFARKTILSYLDELEEIFIMQLQRIVNITTSLVVN